MTTTVEFDFITGQPAGARLPRVALADIFELGRDNGEERLAVGGVVVNLRRRGSERPTRVEVKPGAFLIRLRTPEGQLLMKRVYVQPSDDTSLVFLPKQLSEKPEKPRAQIQKSVAQRSVVPSILLDGVEEKKPTVPREWWSALPMARTEEPITIANLPGFHASELVQSKHDFVGIARLQAEALREIPSPDSLSDSVTAKLVGEIAAVQGAKLHGTKDAPFAKWKTPLRDKRLVGDKSQEGKGSRYFSLSYRAEGELNPIQVACVPGRWVRRDGNLADVYADYYERSVGNISTRSLRVEVDDPDLGGLLDFLQQGDLGGSARMLSNATELLYRKWSNPYASAAAGYVLVQVGDWPGAHGNWRQWILNLAYRYSSLPDGAILFTTLLLQGSTDDLKNLHYEHGGENPFRNAVTAALEAVRRGPPLFRHGIKMMATNLAILESETKNQAADEQTYRTLKAASRYVRELSLRVDPNQPFCVFDV